MKMLYFRDIQKHKIRNTSGDEVEIDCFSLTPVERLFISAYLTKISTDTDKTLAQIIFCTNSHEITLGQYEDFDKYITKVLKDHVDLLHWIKDNFAINKEETGPRRFSIYADVIDNADFFLTRCGSDGKKGTGINQIAFKAFCLAAAASSTKKIAKLREICLYHYLIDDLSKLDKKIKNRRCQIINLTSKWAEKAKIRGHYDKDYYIIDGVDNTPENDDDKETEIINKIKEKAIEEAQESRTESEDSILELDEYHDYQKDFQRFKDKYGADKIVKILTGIDNKIFSFTRETQKIADRLGIKHEAVMKYYETQYVDDKDGGFAMKKALHDEFKKLRAKVDCLTFDTSWMPKNNLEYGKLFKAYAYSSFPRLMAF